MFDQVVKYARDQGLETEPGFARKPVAWAIQCASDGRFVTILPLSRNGKPRGFDRCPDLSQGDLVSGKTARSQFLVESLQTVVLYAKEGESAANLEKARAKHRFFVSLLREASAHLPELAAAADMLSDDATLAAIRAELVALSPKPKPTDTATVWIDTLNPLQSDRWHDWWRGFRRVLHEDGGKTVRSRPRRMRCLLSGETVKPAVTHKKIRGLAGVGGLGTGDVVIGFDKESFRSYGLEKSANAAVSEGYATLYAETLNRLIAERSLKLGDALVVFWYSRPVFREDDPFAFLAEPETPEAGAQTLPKKLLRAIARGERADLADNHYCALTLSGAAGRVMVRRWMEGRFEDLAASVDRWFSDLGIVGRRGGGLARLPKFLAVAGATERDLADVPAPAMAQLWAAAIGAGAIPRTAHARALLRVRADIIQGNSANHARMGLLKACHIRNHGDTDMKPYLNPDHPSPAYHAGRLMAVLANLQRAALGDIGASVVQRYYAAASQMPALVLGRLLGNAKNHLAKLDGGLPFWYEKQIAEVMGRIRDTIPRTLDLEQQSLFALGYYQQLAALRAGSGGPVSDEPSQSEKE